MIKSSILQEIELLKIIDMFIFQRIESGKLPQKANIARIKIQKMIFELQN